MTPSPITSIDYMQMRLTKTSNFCGIRARNKRASNVNDVPLLAPDATNLYMEPQDDASKIAALYCSRPVSWLFVVRIIRYRIQIRKYILDVKVYMRYLTNKTLSVDEFSERVLSLRPCNGASR